MEFNIVCVGSLKEDYLKDAQKEYIKRIGGYCKVNVIECKEADYKDLSTQSIINAKKKEAEQIGQHLKGFVVALEVEGKQFTSLEFAQKIKKLEVDGISCVTLIIGGSYGIFEELSARANLKLSFGKFTLPHQLIRVVLLEQIYRAITINNNKTYHK